MKFVIAVVFCLAFSQAFAFPSFDDFEETQEFESAVAEAGEEESVRVERNTYGHGGYEHQVQPVHHQVHAYASHAPKVECGSNLLVGCHPVVAKAPCVPSYDHAYKGQSHGYKASADADAMASNAAAQNW